MNVEIGAEAALLIEKEYKNGIAIAVQWKSNKEDCLTYIEGNLV